MVPFPGEAHALKSGPIPPYPLHLAGWLGGFIFMHDPVQAG